jgi:two-component system response regulator VicR
MLKAKILIAADDPYLTMYVSVLQPEGYEILSTLKGLECLRLAREHQPELIIIDNTLRDMEITELLRQLKSESQTSGAKLLLLHSQEIPAGDQMSEQKSFIDGYVRKPFAPPNSWGACASCSARAVMKSSRVR